MTESLSLLTAVMLGLLGGAHCLGMCGGIAATVSIGHAGQSNNTLLLLGYNSGRIVSYTLAGALIGQLGVLVDNQLAALIMRTVAGLMLIAMGLYIARWWQGLTKLERAGGVLWRHLQPFAKKLMPVRNGGQAIALGAVWGWLPCGLVYSTLIWSSAAGDWQQSAMLMAAFGIGTLPAMLLTGILARQAQAILQQAITQRIAGSLIIAFGLYTIPLTGWLVG